MRHLEMEWGAPTNPVIKLMNSKGGIVEVVVLRRRGKIEEKVMDGYLLGLDSP